MAETFLSGFYLEELAGEAAQSGAARCRVTIVAGAEPPPVPSGMRQYPTRHGICYSDGESYHVEVSGSRVVIGPPGSQSVDVWLGSTPRALGPVARVNVMSYALHAALRRCGLYDLHAGGAVEPLSGQGVLLVGDSNSGKSTLTVRLARSGWRYLSDDLLILHGGEVGEPVRARPLRRVFSVSAPTLAGCDLPRLEVALGDAVNSDPNKRRLDPSIVFPDLLADSCVPGAIYFPSIVREAESRVEKLSQAQALLRLLRLSPWASFDKSAAETLNFFRRLVGQAPAFELRAGRDILDDPGLAPRLISRRFGDQ